MWAKFSKRWPLSEAGTPGRRFQDRYERNQRRGDQEKVLNLIVHVALAMVMFVIGVALVFLPGPAVVFFFASGAFLAADLLVVARFMDWSEVRMRAAWNWSRRHWRKLPMAGKAGLLLIGVVGCVAVMFCLYRLFVSGLV